MATVVGGFLIGVGFALAGLGGAAPLLGLLLAPLFALPFILPGELKHARGGRLRSGPAEATTPPTAIPSPRP